jgi:hypothetical protein
MEKKKKKPTKEDIDRGIMRALCNFVNAETREYKIFLMIGSERNDYMYLATHAKRAGVNLEIAIQESTPFLKNRFPETDDEFIRMAFEHYYPSEETVRSYRRWFIENMK